jgi:hypothetical protein
MTSRLAEVVFLTRARAKVAARSRAHQELVWRWWRAARSRLRIAERLDPRTELAAALPLYREGFIALVCAAVAAVDGDAEAPKVADIDAAWEALDRVWSKLEAGVEISRFDDARKMLLERATLDAPPPGDASACASTDRLTHILERAIEPRTTRRLAWGRNLRVGALVVLPAALLAWLAPPLFEPKSLALHKPVKVSSSHPDSMAPATGEWLVNGRIERTYGMHTNVEDNPWMSIDLEQPAPVRRIVVYNRGDGWFDDCLPLQVEVGVTDDALHVLATRDKGFTQFNPWVIRLDESVRFIRLTKKGHGSCALSEVGVYSR